MNAPSTVELIRLLSRAIQAEYGSQDPSLPAVMVSCESPGWYHLAIVRYNEPFRQAQWTVCSVSSERVRSGVRSLCKKWAGMMVAKYRLKQFLDTLEAM